VYQVIRTEGEYEPWWFFEDWMDFIVESADYADFQEAVAAYERAAEKLSVVYPFQKTKETYLTAYWSDGEIRFCENCDDDVQLYHGLMLLQDGKKLLQE